MAASEGKVKFTYGGDSFEIPLPMPEFTTTINFPFDIVKVADGTYDVYDAGSSYDVRFCECVFELSTTDHATFIESLSGTGTPDLRSNNAITMELPDASGFHPFGPDKADDGSWTVGIEHISSEGIGRAPWKYWHTKVRLTNQGAFPAHTLPSDIGYGSWQFGSVTNVTMPQSWFNPDVKYGVNGQLERSGDLEFFNNGSGADTYDTQFTILETEAKASRIVNYISSTARGGQFPIYPADNYYPFEYEIGTTGSITVLFIAPEMKVKFNRYNRWEIPMRLNYNI